MNRIRIYNSSDLLIFDGDLDELNELKKNHLINDSDRIVIVEDE